MSTVIGASYGSALTAAERTASGKGFSVGDTSTDSDGKVWLYIQATADLVLGHACVVSASGTAINMNTTNGLRGLRVGVASTSIANGSYGWLQVYGAASLGVIASCAANVRLNTTATAGRLDDDATIGAKEILGIALTTAREATNGTAPAMLNYPSVGVTL